MMEDAKDIVMTALTAWAIADHEKHTNVTIRDGKLSYDSDQLKRKKEVAYGSAMTELRRIAHWYLRQESDGTIRKHYYDDRSGLNWDDDNRELIAELAQVLPNMVDSVVDNPSPEAKALSERELGKITNIVSNLTYAYMCMESMEGLGGGKTIAEWREETETDPVHNVVKKMFFEFVDAGYEAKEFQLVMVPAFSHAKLHQGCTN